MTIRSLLSDAFKILLLLFFVVGSQPGKAQDTLKAVVTDSLKLKSEKRFNLHLLPEEHSPKTAALASAILPGLGQAYNKKYWKIPIVYAGIGTAGYFIYYNYTIYKNFRDAYSLQLDGDSTTNLESFSVWYITGKQVIHLNGFDGASLQTVENEYRNYLDLSIIVTAGVYALNILDAVVDAHFYDFDVSDNLSMNVRPFVLPGFNTASREGLTFTLTFR